MDNWEAQIINWLADVQKEINNFYQQVDEDINRTVKVVNQDIEQWIEDCEDYLNDVTIEFNNLMVETDSFLTELIYLFFDDEILHEDYSLEDSIENWEEWLEDDYQRKPNSQKHPACVGCSHYYGHSYGGNLLVCAMHPYGWENENCPDWEGE
jgi:hypothetical protein